MRCLGLVALGLLIAPAWGAERIEGDPRSEVDAGIIGDELPLSRNATPAPVQAQVYFLSPRDGDEVKNPVRIVFGLRGMGVAPAGIHKDGTGHHHLLIDEPAVDLDLPLGISDQIRHYSAGQTETMLKMKPGKHVLQLVLGDARHRPHQPPVVSEKITITVK